MAAKSKPPKRWRLMLESVHAPAATTTDRRPTDGWMAPQLPTRTSRRRRAVTSSVA
ncbi:MAG: hypothetical protein R2749_09895 [Acidimicrobiales bacterium]